MGTEVCAAFDTGCSIDQECDGDEDTACYDEGQHVADAVHQVLVQLAAEGLVVFNRNVLSLLVGMEDGSLAVDDLVDQLFRLMDSVCHLGGIDRFSVETCRLHALVSGNNDAVAVCDLFRGQHILCAAGAVGLDFNVDSHGFTGLGQCFSSHVCMGDAGGACGDGQDTGAGLLSNRCGSHRSFRFFRCFFRELLRFLCIDDGKEFLRSLCFFQAAGEFRIHQKLHHPCQHFQVYIPIRGGCDHEQQFAGISVRCIIVHTLRNGDGSQSGSLDCFAFCVGDGDLHADGGGAHLLAFQDPFLVCGDVVQAAAFVVKGYQHLNGFRFICGSCIEQDSFLFQKIRNTHILFSFFYSCFSSLRCKLPLIHRSVPV